MEKYLQKYAEPEVLTLQGFPSESHYENVTVIPVFNEGTGLLRPPPPCNGISLLILVINQPVSRDINENNEVLAAEVKRRFDLKWESPAAFEGFGLCLFRDTPNHRDILLVDRFNRSRQLPVKGGVGLARKIGADLAASLIHNGHVRSSWIHCTDADVLLPETYYETSTALPNKHKKFSALIYPYLHTQCSDEKIPSTREQEQVEFATQIYEKSLRYYVAGLKYAGSPYAFHTIGSTMAIDAGHYAKVRGFPRRAAGEDFYLLNKLAKTGEILEMAASSQCKPIQIAARRSDRVPFGTGAAVIKISELDDMERDFIYYHPKVFLLLKHWLDELPEIWGNQEYVLDKFVQKRLSDDEMDESHQHLIDALKAIGTEAALDHAFRQSKNPEQFLKQMHTWFDAFRTLKLIHYLRDHHLPSINRTQLVSNPQYVQIQLKNSNQGPVQKIQSPINSIRLEGTQETKWTKPG